MNRFAFIIGLENYAEEIPGVRFADNDAAEFAKCIIELGFDDRDVACLTHAQATKTTIEAEVRRLASLAQKGDDVLFFFAGHGISIQATNYLTCYDTVRTDLVNTCIPLQWILDLLRASKASRKILFLDCCHGGLDSDESKRGVIDTLNEGDLAEFFAGAEHEVGFVSCRDGQSSYSSPNLRHGIWTFLLLEALRGTAPDAIEKNKHITSASLQNFLADRVPQTLREEHPDPVVQTPKGFGSISHNFSLFDSGKIITKRATEKRARLIGVASIDLLGSQGGSIKELSGFKKGLHKIPDAIDDYTQSYVERIASDDATHEGTRTFEQLKKNFGYKRKEIKLETHGSSADIATKDFDLRITYSQDSRDAKSYTVEYLITNIRNPDVLEDEGLQKIFAQHFDEVRFSLEGKIDLEELIDSLEAEDRDQVTLMYPADCSSLTISLKGRNWSIHVSGAGVSVVKHFLGPPATLFHCLTEARSLISGTSQLCPFKLEL